MKECRTEVILNKTQNVPKVKHWYWDNWVMLSLTCACCLTLREVMIGEFSQLAYEGLYYIGTGPLLPNILYFIYRKEWARRNSFSDKDNASVKKVLTRTWDNRLDWWTIAILVVAAGFQVLFYLSVILAFKAAR